MTTIDMRQFDDQSFVLHFGGRPNEIDAITFGNALVAIAEAVRSINAQANVGHSLELTIEAVGPGSFRAKLKTVRRTLKNLFSKDGVGGQIAISLLATFLWEKAISPDSPPTIIIDGDAVIIQHGDDRIIVPKEVFDTKDRVARDPAVNRHIAKAMDILEADPAVTSLGITPDIRDEKPLIEFPRAAFPAIREQSLALPDGDRRHSDEQAVLSVHKAVFERSARKWEFVWNGFRISAPITDPTFFDRLERRDVSLSQGDAFQAVLRVFQHYDRLSGTWLNERYEVIAVGDVVYRKPDQDSAGF